MYYVSIYFKILLLNDKTKRVDILENNSLNKSGQVFKQSSWNIKGIAHQFWVYNIFSCLNKRIISYERSISIKQLWLEINEKIGCSKSVRPSTVIYIIYVTRTDFEHPIFSIISSQSCFIEMNLS